MNALAATLVMLSAADAPPTDLLCCGAEEVFAVSPGDEPTPGVTWSWRAEDSPGIAEDARAWFRSTDECKPVGDAVLIASSAGGVALIGRADKRCRFLTFARNAHSACLLPGRRVAVAASFNGDHVWVYDVTGGAEVAEPVGGLPLIGAHGVVWDAGRGVLWALGEERLLQVRLGEETPAAGRPATTLRIEREWPLPSRGGHDLSPVGDDRHLFVTTNSGVYRFDREAGVFAADAEIGGWPVVKSVSRHPTTGEVVFHAGTEETWWSDTIRFVGGRQDVVLRGRRLYKVRWDVPAQMPAGWE